MIEYWFRFDMNNNPYFNLDINFQIQQIINRILSFPVNQPLMKFLTGLEILLRQSQVSQFTFFHQISLWLDTSSLLWRQ